MSRTELYEGDQFLRVLGTQFEITRTLAHALGKYGASAEALRYILKNPSLADIFAREILGDVAKLCGQVLPLEVDWETDLYELQDQMSGLVTMPMGMSVHTEDQRWNSWYLDKPRPEAPCDYMLFLPEGRVNPRAIYSEMDCAGYRELIAFAKRYLLEASVYIHHPIVAGGSPKQTKGKIDPFENFTLPCFTVSPRPAGNSSGNWHSLAWYGVGPGLTYDFGTMFLVRVPRRNG